MRLVQARLCAGNPDKPPRVCYEVREGPFMCQEKSRKQFSLLWKSCEFRANLFYVRETPNNAILTSEGMV